MTNQFQSGWTPEPKKEKNVATCEKCKCQWFEQVQVNQYMADHTTVLGQRLPPVGDMQFVLLRCVKCGEKYQPNVLINQQDTATKLYNSMLDQLDTPVEEPKK